MKCFVHTDKDAVGVCSVCGRGVCENCAVKIGNKLYCRECVDKEFAAKTVVTGKPTGITLLTILFGLGGALNLVDGALTLEGYLLLIQFGYPQEMALMQVLLWGIISIILGVMFLITAYYMWNLKRRGGLMGVILVFFALILNLRVFTTNLYSINTFISSIIAIIINILILLYLRKIWTLLQ